MYRDKSEILHYFENNKKIILILICQHFLSFAVISKLWLLLSSQILSCKPHALTQDEVIKCLVNEACLVLGLESQITQVIWAAG